MEREQGDGSGWAAHDSNRRSPAALINRLADSWRQIWGPGHASVDPLLRPSKRSLTHIDYYTPSIAKETHLRHSRPTTICDALARILGALGHEAVRQRDMGTGGTAIGTLIEDLTDKAEAEAAVELSMGGLGTLYWEPAAGFGSTRASPSAPGAGVVALQSGHEIVPRASHLRT